jgi:hypothetical protein
MLDPKQAVVLPDKQPVTMKVYCMQHVLQEIHPL